MCSIISLRGLGPNRGEVLESVGEGVVAMFPFEADTYRHRSLLTSGRRRADDRARLLIDIPEIWTIVDVETGVVLYASTSALVRSCGSFKPITFISATTPPPAGEVPMTGRIDSLSPVPDVVQVIR